MSGGLRVDDGGARIHFTSESYMQEQLAEMAYLCGWEVERERHIPGWGRMDLLLSGGDWSWGVELKLDLIRPRDIRRAFQQADGYRRSMPELSAVILAASKMSPDVFDYEAAYSDVTLFDIGTLMGLLLKGNTNTRWWAQSRNAQLRARAALSDSLLERMAIVAEAVSS